MNVRVESGEVGVLIVEDEGRLREMLVRAVTGMGFLAHGARSAEEGLRMLESADAKIVILDLNLPGKNGMDFFRDLKVKRPGIQVIILTGFGDLEAAKEAIRLDVVDFLTKPCELGELERSLDRARRKLEEKTPAVVDAGAMWPAEEGKDGPPTLGDVERQTILAALERNKGNRAVTAEELGISLRTLYYRLGEYQKLGFRVD